VSIACSSWSRQFCVTLRAAAGAYVERGEGGAILVEGRVELLEEVPWQAPSAIRRHFEVSDRGARSGGCTHHVHAILSYSAAISQSVCGSYRSGGGRADLALWRLESCEGGISVVCAGLGGRSRMGYCASWHGTGRRGLSNVVLAGRTRGFHRPLVGQSHPADRFSAGAIQSFPRPRSLAFPTTPRRASLSCSRPRLGRRPQSRKYHPVFFSSLW
jgi:hypothetical protein